MIKPDEKMNTQLLSEIIGVSSSELGDAGVIDAYPFADKRSFVNADRILKTKIPEFIDAKSSIINHIFVEAMNLGELRNVFPPEIDMIRKDGTIKYKFTDPNYKIPLEEWKAGENHRSYFGLTKDNGKKTKGKGLGPHKKDNFVNGFNRYLRKVFESLKNDDKRARFFNFLGIYVHNVGIDNLSDLLINSLEEEFATYTNNKIIELNVPDEFVKIENGKKLLFLLDKSDNVYEFKYFFPIEFMTDLPLVELGDFRALSKSYNNESWNAIAALVKTTKNSALDDIQKENLSEYISADDMFKALDFREFKSIFLTKFKDNVNPTVINELFEIVKDDEIDSHQFIDNFINKFSDVISRSKINLFTKKDKTGSERLYEGNFQAAVEMLLRYSKLDYSSNEKLSMNGEMDLSINHNGTRTLLELKVMNGISKINSVLNNYKNQTLDYNFQKSYDSTYFILMVKDLNSDELKRLYNSLLTANNDFTINKKFVIIAMGDAYVTGSRQTSKFKWKSKVIHKLSDIDDIKLPPNEYRDMVTEMQKEYHMISGKLLNSVDVRVIKDKIKEETFHRNKLKSQIIQLHKWIGTKEIPNYDDDNKTLEDIINSLKKEWDEKRKKQSSWY